MMLSLLLTLACSTEEPAPPLRSTLVEEHKEAEPLVISELSRPDGRKALRDAEVQLDEITLPFPREELSEELSEGLAAALNTVVAPCEPCMSAGLSIASCKRSEAPNCEILDQLITRAFRGLRVGLAPEQVKPLLRYEDPWQPVTLSERPRRGGGADAAVQVLLAVDHASPYAPGVYTLWSELSRDYGEQLSFALLQLPSDRSPQSAQAAKDLLGQPAEDYWARHEELMLAADKLPELLAGQGSDLLDDPQLREERKVAQELGVRGAPTAFINGHRIRGAREAEVYRRWIEIELSDRGLQWGD